MTADAVDEWLAGRRSPAPEPVREAVEDLVADTGVGAALHDRFAAAALSALADVVNQPSARDTAMTLLAADALLTYACEAALESGLDVLDDLTARLDFARFSQLNPEAE